jgi:WD40 repeat protein
VGEIPVDLATYEDLTLAGWSGLNPFVAGFTKAADEIELRSWDPLTGKDIHPATVVGRDLARPTLARPQGFWLAVADEQDQVLLLDVQSGVVTQTLAGHRDSVASLAWSANGDLLASSAADGTVILWDVVDGRSRLRLVPPGTE